MDIFVFIRENMESQLQYCQVQTANGESMEDSFFFCDRKANPADAQTVIYYQRMGEYISERGIIISYGHNIKNSHNWLASSPLANRIDVLFEHNVFMSEYLTNYWQEFLIYPPKARALGPIDHINFLKAVCFGKTGNEMSIEFDATTNNFFHTIQKIHVLVIESVHTGYTKYLDENTYIINTKEDIKKEFRHCNDVSSRSLPPLLKQYEKVVGPTVFRIKVREIIRLLRLNDYSN